MAPRPVKRSSTTFLESVEMSSNAISWTIGGMKPRLFIGSSTEGKSVADAIHTELQGDAECTVWTQGVFGLSESNTESLMKQVKTSEFGVFVFSADDTVKMRGALFSTPRDNVVYELGLFSGALGPERCFFVTPKDTGIHLPTDLMGMTAGWYETGRQDKEMQPAVGPFCNNVRRKINETTFGIDFIHPDNNTSLSSGKHILTCKCNVYPGSDILLFVQNQHRWYPKRDRLGIGAISQIYTTLIATWEAWGFKQYISLRRMILERC